MSQFHGGVEVGALRQKLLDNGEITPNDINCQTVEEGDKMEGLGSAVLVVHLLTTLLGEDHHRHLQICLVVGVKNRHF